MGGQLLDPLQAAEDAEAGLAEEDLERGEGIPIEEGLEFVINRLVARALSAQQ